MKNMRQDKLFSHPDAQYLSIFFLQRYAVPAPHYNFSSIFFNLFIVNQVLQSFFHEKLLNSL